jgi:FkbM family methyltransferase
VSGLTRDHVVWAYRLLLDREPESEDAIQPKLRAWRTPRELRTDIMSSEEYRLKNPDHAAASRTNVVIKPLPSGVRIAIDLADHVIGLGILRGGYEESELTFAVNQLRPGDVALDIGAHIGFFALQLAHAVGATGQVYAFEPLDRNADLLAQSIRENGFEDRLRLERAAVADHTGTATLRFARETLNTGGAFLAEGNVSDLGGLAAITVPTIRLDDYQLRRPIRLIKMDVEGAEPRVIAGAATVIGADRPVIISEIHPEQLARVCQASPATLVAQLSGLGLTPHRIEGGRIGAALNSTDITGVTTVAFVPR